MTDLPQTVSPASAAPPALESMHTAACSENTHDAMAVLVPTPVGFVPGPPPAREAEYWLTMLSRLSLDDEQATPTPPPTPSEAMQISDEEEYLTSPASAALPAQEFEYTSCPIWNRYIPIFQVAFKHGWWWSIPSKMSQQIYDQYKNQQNAGYTWDWGDARAGSWQPDGQQTSINRYVIDFDKWEQRNVDNDRRRSVRLVWVTVSTPEQ